MCREASAALGNTGNPEWYHTALPEQISRPRSVSPLLATDQLVQLREGAAMPARVTFIPEPSAKMQCRTPRFAYPSISLTSSVCLRQ